MERRIEVFTDGSATTGKPGGWAWVLVVDDQFHSEGSGHLEVATNNDAELEAAIEGLSSALNLVKSTVCFSGVTLVSDSQIILGWASGEYRFKQENKLTKYHLLRSLVQRLNAKTRWVKGHSGDIYNTRCDKLANLARLGETEKLDKPTSKIDTNIGVKKNGVASIWYNGVLKIIDFEKNIIENFNKEVHGKRGSVIEIREGKDR